MRKATVRTIVVSRTLESRLVNWALTVALLLATAPSGGGAYAQTPEEVYQQVKQIEGTINWPSIYVERKVGVFDAATGAFAFSSPGLRTFDETTGGGDPDEGPYDKPKHTHEEGKMPIQATEVGLVFEVKNRAGAFTANVNGKTVAAPPDENSVTVNAGTAAKVKWSVHCGAKGFANEFTIVRSNQFGAGAFTVPALPVAIIYEPPMDAQKKNYATYASTETVGTTVKAGWSAENSTTTPASASRFQSATDFKSDAELAGKALSKIPNAYTKAVGAILGALAAGTGSASVTSQVGMKTTDDEALILNYGQAVSYGTAAKLGPGLGDRIVFLKNARLAWLGVHEMVNVAVLGYEKISSPTVKTLKDDWTELVTANLPFGKSPGQDDDGAPRLGSRTGLDAQTILTLLGLDPFYGRGSLANLDEKRFAYVETFEPNGAADSFTFFYDAAQSYQQAKTTVRVRTEEYSKGFLSFLGLGVTETKKLVMRITASSSQEFHSSRKAEATAHFYAGSREIYTVAIYYDRIFGTFAFKKVFPLKTDIVSGVALAADGRPMERQLVTLTVGGRKFSTRTDSEGRYSFRSSTIGGGDGRIEAGDVTKAVRLQRGKPLRNLELRPLR